MAMLMAEPVMKAEIAISGMKSTIQPQRIKPMNRMIAPQITAKAEAISGGGIGVVWLWLTLVIIFPTSVDITATGFGRC